MSDLLLFSIITFLALGLNFLIACCTYEWYKHTKDE